MTPDLSDTFGAAGERAGGAGEGTESRGRSDLRGLWFGRRPVGLSQTSGALVWLAFILFPAINAFARHGSDLHRGLTVAAAVAFVATYIALVLIWRTRYSDRTLSPLFVVLVALATALTISDGSSWGFLFTYCAACAGLISTRYGFAGVVACSALAGVASAVGGASGGQIVGWVASSAGIGLLILVMRDLRIRNDQLSRARAELARLAVAQERERFARDLHDLLGHSLSVIALKAELAGRLLPDSPSEAATQVAELEDVARGALSEVREAVSGYRQPTLDRELAGARMALSAAGIEAQVDRPQLAIDPEVEAILAWAVREGATNVIRHSRATHCTMTIRSGLTDAAVEVLDDGAGAASPNGAASGHGLAGLAERARDLGGSVEAGARQDGGYRLAVTVPVPRS